MSTATAAWGLDSLPESDWLNQAVCPGTGDLFWSPLGHGVARHLCQAHCPVREQCEQWAADQRLGGAVAGGVLWTGVPGGYAVPSTSQPTPKREGCPICHPEAALVIEPTEAPAHESTPTRVLGPVNLLAEHDRIIAMLADERSVREIAGILGASYKRLRAYLHAQGLKSKAKAVRCGTDNGYKKHHRLREDPCDPCTAAHAAAEVRRRQARRTARVAA
jgi:hypothetical protein